MMFTVEIHAFIPAFASKEHTLLQKAFLHTGGIDLHMRLAGPHARNGLQRSPFAHAAVAAACEDRSSHAVT